MSVLATDNFTRGDNADLGASWDENTGESATTGFDIISNSAQTSSLTDDLSETNNSASFPADQYSTVTFGTTAADGVGIGSGPTGREATGATLTYYRAVGNASGYELNRRVTGTFTILSSGSGTTFASGNTLTLELRTNGANCDWTLKKNGTQFASGSDTSPIASGRAGIGYSSTASSKANAALTGFEAGDFLSSARALFSEDDGDSFQIAQAP